MDAMEVLTNLEHLQPYFQPIFSADEHVVIGYEILGRYVNDSGIETLGSFFQDEKVPEEYRIDVDNHILIMALEKINNTNEDFLIFINRDPNLLLSDHGEDLLSILLKYVGEEHLHRIVVELSENKFRGDIKSLQHLLTYYKTYGIKIAVDHLGTDSPLDRIALLQPQILKINLEQLNYQPWDSHIDIITSLGVLARKIGATMLFENIDSVYQLKFAWKNGGRYYQGFYLAEPDANFIDREHLKERFRKECHSFIISEKKSLEKKYADLKFIQDTIQDIVHDVKPTSNDIGKLKELAVLLEDYSFRIYICDEDGFQKSPNILRKQGGWVIQEEYKNKNWSWRPYFLKTIIKMRNDQKGFLSEAYTDIENGEMTRTFSIPVNESEYLFIDITYDYLFEHDIF